MFQQTKLQQKNAVAKYGGTAFVGYDIFMKPQRLIFDCFGTSVRSIDWPGSCMQWNLVLT